MEFVKDWIIPTIPFFITVALIYLWMRSRKDK